MMTSDAATPPEAAGNPNPQMVKWNLEITEENFQTVLDTLQNSGNLPENPGDDDVGFPWTAALSAYIWAIANTFKFCKGSSIFIPVSESESDQSRKENEKKVHHEFDAGLHTVLGRQFHSSPPGKDNPGCQIDRYMSGFLHDKIRRFCDHVIPRRPEPTADRQLDPKWGARVFNTRSDHIICELKVSGAVTARNDSFSIPQKCKEQLLAYKRHVGCQQAKALVWWTVFIENQVWVSTDIQITFFDEKAKTKWLGTSNMDQMPTTPPELSDIEVIELLTDSEEREVSGDSGGVETEDDEGDVSSGNRKRLRSSTSDDVSSPAEEDCEF